MRLLLLCHSFQLFVYIFILICSLTFNQSILYPSYLLVHPVQTSLRKQMYSSNNSKNDNRYSNNHSHNQSSSYMPSQSNISKKQYPDMSSLSYSQSGLYGTGMQSSTNQQHSSESHSRLPIGQSTSYYDNNNYDQGRSGSSNNHTHNPYNPISNYDYMNSLNSRTGNSTLPMNQGSGGNDSRYPSSNWQDNSNSRSRAYNNTNSGSGMGMNSASKNYYNQNVTPTNSYDNTSRGGYMPMQSHNNISSKSAEKYQVMAQTNNPYIPSYNTTRQTQLTQNFYQNAYSSSKPVYGSAQYNTQYNSPSTANIYQSHQPLGGLSQSSRLHNPSVGSSGQQPNIVQRLSMIIKPHLPELKKIMAKVNSRKNDSKSHHHSRHSRQRSPHRRDRSRDRGQSSRHRNNSSRDQSDHRHGGSRGSGQRKKSASQWVCGSCEFLNFEWREKCKKCNVGKPSKSFSQGPEDWKCPKCQNLNYARRNQCNRCRLPRNSSFKEGGK